MQRDKVALPCMFRSVTLRCIQLSGNSFRTVPAILIPIPITSVVGGLKLESRTEHFEVANWLRLFRNCFGTVQ